MGMKRTALSMSENHEASRPYKYFQTITVLLIPGVLLNFAIPLVSDFPSVGRPSILSILLFCSTMASTRFVDRGAASTGNF